MATGANDFPLSAFIESRDQVLNRRAAETGIVRYACAIGMIWGVFIGAAVSGFACFLAAVIKILRIRFECRKSQEANNTPDGIRR